MRSQSTGLLVLSIEVLRSFQGKKKAKSSEWSHTGTGGKGHNLGVFRFITDMLKCQFQSYWWFETHSPPLLPSHPKNEKKMTFCNMIEQKG